jgi:hypothetical protein
MYVLQLIVMLECLFSPRIFWVHVIHIGIDRTRIISSTGKSRFRFSVGVLTHVAKLAPSLLLIKLKVTSHWGDLHNIRPAGFSR